MNSKLAKFSALESFAAIEERLVALVSQKNADNSVGSVPVMIKQEFRSPSVFYNVSVPPIRLLKK